MFLVRLELQGFKTFAKKTVLSFLPPKAETKPITAIVGPNGSGKSNISDAIRWVLGEQSLKVLRGKKSEDVIFSGSEKRGRSGFAEASLTFNNEDKSMPVDFAEVTLTRRLYRDGESEYLVNGAPARLADIHLLLAQANVGQRSYSVISQGMVDHVLVSTPEERKQFFDDATGVRPLQIKRHEALLKLKRTAENMAEVEMLLREIDPRLRSLKRQVSRLEARAEVERELHELERGYYGTCWWKLQDEWKDARGRQAEAEAAVTAERAALGTLEARVNELEKDERAKNKEDEGLMALQAQYREAQERRSRVRDQRFDVQKQMELGKIRAQSAWAPLPLIKIVEELGVIEQEQRSLLSRVRGAKTMEDVRALYPELDRAVARTGRLAGRLQRPAPEDAKPDPALVEKFARLEREHAEADAVLAGLEERLASYAAQEKQVRTELFDLQRDLRDRQKALHAAENLRNAVQIDAARLEERARNLERELEEQTAPKNGDANVLAAQIRAERPSHAVDTDAAHADMQRLRYKLELIGGIDPEIAKEYGETKERFAFLDGQMKDLRAAFSSTENVLDELEEDIKKQSADAFRGINREFQRFFKTLFGGGSCSLVQLAREDLAPGEEEPAPQTVAEEEARHEEDAAEEGIRNLIREREDRVVGIDIQATPPGKRLKSLNLLSGGERALVSIALVSAIMAVNPSPFVILDEVDASLDEANTFRFANIISELAHLTQYILITHNRATMEKADLLYGVTMSDEGVSNLISVKLEDVADAGTARR